MSVLVGLSTGLSCGKQGADIVFALDASYSIWPLHFKKQLQFVVNVVEQFPIGTKQSDFHVAVVTYSENITVQFNLRDFFRKDQLKRAVMRIRQYSPGGTYTHKALEYIRRQMFTIRNGGRTYSDKIVVVITDGLSQNPKSTRIEAARAHYEGIQIFAIGVGAGVDKHELEMIASSPSRNHVFTVDNYSILNSIKRKVARETCKVPIRREKPRSDIDPSIVYAKKKLAKQKCGGKPADVYFLLDSSSSIWQPDFKKELKFVEHVMDLFNTENGNTQIALVTFSDKVQPVINLGTYNNSKMNEMLSRPEIYLTGGVTDTAEAIKYVRENGFQGPQARKGVAQIMIVLTDGQSEDYENTVRESRLTHQAGIYVFAIGIGKDADYKELKQIASDPDINFVFRVDVFDALESIKDILVFKTCEVAVEIPMRNPPVASKFPKKRLDVMFLVDDCQFGHKNLHLIKEFIASLTRQMHIGSYWTRVGAFSSQCSQQHNDIYLTEYRTSQDFIADFTKPDTHSLAWLIRRLRHHGFDPSNGGRDDAPHIGVLFVDDKLTEADASIVEAKRARFKGVKLFVVAIGKEYSFNEVRQLAYRNMYIRVRDYTYLQRHISDFMDTMLKGL